MLLLRLAARSSIFLTLGICCILIFSSHHQLLPNFLQQTLGLVRARMASTACLNCGLTAQSEPHSPHFVPPLPTSSPLLLTNEPPIDSDIQYIRSFLSNATSRVDSLDQRLSALALARDALTQERDTILADVRSHTAIVSPVRYLPSEILCRIFLMTVPPLRNLEFPRAPWALGHICQRWRNISLALPMLWSSFGIDSKRSHRSEAFDTQFSRAGQSYLQITILSASAPPFPPLDTLITASDRWDALAVKDAGQILPIISNVKGKTPSLRRFYTDRISPDSKQILESCLSLCDIRASTSGTGLQPSAKIDWHNITRYSGTVSSVEYLDLIRRTPNLVECRLNFTGLPRSSDFSRDIVLLPSLTRLFVTGTWCLEFIAAPRLEELALDLRCTACEPEHVSSFVKRSSCTIIRLSYFRCDDMSPWLPILEKMRSILELTVVFNYGSTNGASFIENMTPKADDTHPLLPNLLAISVGDMVSPTFRIRSFLKMLDSRAKYCRPVEFWGLMMNINIHHLGSFTKLIRTSSSCLEMQKLRDSGLHIRLLQTNQLFQEVLDTDPYSIQRCGKYDGITTLKLWDDPCTCHHF
ncbi:hypothetical protein DFH09DRAFT_1280583 [Mycena vulgaris]|nr:hypothetical protein DFH09DRAFT_1280583 [Mycena vulgaris]